MSDFIQTVEGWVAHRVVLDGVATCDCGHPETYHRDNRCHYCPPHSRVRCACRAVTTTGVPRNELVHQGSAP